ncbi:hypothetical protein ACF09H_22310 [Streptomyces sp. NPDC014983]
MPIFSLGGQAPAGSTARNWVIVLAGTVAAAQFVGGGDPRP